MKTLYIYIVAFIGLFNFQSVLSVYYILMFNILCIAQVGGTENKWPFILPRPSGVPLPLQGQAQNIHNAQDKGNYHIKYANILYIL